MISVVRILRNLLVTQSLSALVLLIVSAGSAHGASIDPDRPTVLITGSNRGIGLAFVKHYVAEGWNVLATARTPSRADELNALAEEYEHLLIEQLDVTDDERIVALATAYAGTPIDVLINNAGIYGGPEEQTLGSLDAQTFHEVMAVNVLAPMKMAEAFADHVAASGQKKIVSITSGAGSVSRETISTGGAYYGISKTALNMAMRKIGAELAGRGILVALVAPGPTVTDMLQTNRPSLVPRANTSEDAAAGMAAVIEGLDASYDGRPLSFDGSTVAW
ncbi:MAG: SDR family oxidoreductase [Rhodospirillaceae bacterium]|nr:SDR family oxidoreductase [Rhodospirillaceae bacterium]